mgnify:FL=1
MEERSDLTTEELGSVVAGYGEQGYEGIECDRQADGRWRVRAWQTAVRDDEAE